MSSPWLSVVMPTYNGAAYISAALQSIRDQQGLDIEVIAIDDGSTDDTVAILESFSDTLPLQIIEGRHVGNWVSNTNYGLSLARGEYACFLHQDDLWLADRLSVLRALAAKEPEATMLLHPSWYLDARGRRVGLWRCPLPHKEEGLQPAFVLERLLVQNFISMPAPLFRRDTALQVGGLNEELWYTADWDFWLKLAYAGTKIYYYPKPLSAFRVHALSQTVRRSTKSDEFRGQLEVVLEKHLSAQEFLQPDGTAVGAAARFSVEVNMLLAAAAHGQEVGWARLAQRFLQLGPSGWRRYMRDSRIAERVLARVRVSWVIP